VTELEQTGASLAHVIHGRINGAYAAPVRSVSVTLSSLLTGPIRVESVDPGAAGDAEALTFDAGDICRFEPSGRPGALPIGLMAWAEQQARDWVAAQPNAGRVCGRCRFAVRGDRTVECRRFPPTWQDDGSFFPILDVTEWCGEWVKR
jgi:hypothetical protein